MIQRFAHWIGGVALHWFYRDVRITGSDRIPLQGPILIAMNHQNALVDAILALWIIPRDVRLTAKATLGDGIFGRLLLKVVGIIPLQRASDGPTSSDPTRNRNSFKAIIEEMRRGGAVLVFPEGKSHNEPEIAPLKTGLARAALRARETGVAGIRIIPIGITFEEKSEPDTAVHAQVGDPIVVDDWNGDDPRVLTRAIADALRTISLTGDINPRIDSGSAQRNGLIRLAAWWGRTMHTIPLRIARREAVRLSDDEGEPAMYTMTLGLGAIIVSYLIEVPIACLLFGRIVALLFFASLITGAYWAAYADHSPERSRVR
ncbi:MAG: 1-acyl-sn-glycerol-3-phosphate acyltransferase [Gemmatimonadaceae bacterium]